MNNDSSLKILKDFLQERTDVDIELVTPDASLETLGIDSLTQLELLFEFEEKLGISLPDVEERPKTIGDLIELVEKHIQAHPESTI